MHGQQNIKTYLMLSLFSENLVVYDIMRKNVNWPENIIRNILFSYWEN